MTNKKSSSCSLIVVSLTLMTILSLSSLISTSAQEQTLQGPCPGKTQYPWPMFLHDNNGTSFSPGPGPKTNHIVWQAITDTAVRCMISVADGMVFANEQSFNPGAIFAFDAETGELIWKVQSWYGGVGSKTVAGGLVYAQVVGPIPWTAFSVSDGIEYIVALDEWSGNLIWKYPIGVDVVAPTYRGTWWGPAFANQRIVACSSWNEIYSLTARASVMKHSDPYLNWKTNLTEYSGSAGSYGCESMPTVADGKVYAGSTDGNVYCLDEENGDILWAYPTGAEIFTGASVVDGKVYVGSADTYFYCLDASTGDLIWRFKEESLHGMYQAIAYGKVYFCSFDSYVYCCNKDTGDLIWKYQTGRDIFTCPVVADGVVYVGSNDRNVYALDAENGDLLWKYDLGYLQEIAYSLAVADGRLYVGSGVHYADWGQLTCFGKGPTSTSISLTSSSMKLGDSARIYGSVKDQSPFSLKRPDLQPPEVTGVPVTLGYCKDGGAMTTIAMVTTDSMGGFTYEWTPTADGTYDLYASFAGDDSYEPSMESVKVQVGHAPPEFPDVPTADEVAQEVLDQLPEYPAYTTTDILIAAVAVVTLVLVLYTLVTVRKTRK